MHGRQLIHDRDDTADQPTPKLAFTQHFMKKKRNFVGNNDAKLPKTTVNKQSKKLFYGVTNPNWGWMKTLPGMSFRQKTTGNIVFPQKSCDNNQIGFSVYFWGGTISQRVVTETDGCIMKPKIVWKMAPCSHQMNSTINFKRPNNEPQLNKWFSVI